jgi:hypothetical protein
MGSGWYDQRVGSASSAPFTDAIGGTALILFALFGFFAGLHRKFDDQAKQIEHQQVGKLESVSRAS